MNKRGVVVNGEMVVGIGFVYDECHKIYVLENEEDKQDAIKMGYIGVYPLVELERVYLDSCPLKFISNWKLDKSYVGQDERAIFKYVELDEIQSLAYDLNRFRNTLYVEIVNKDGDTESDFLSNLSNREEVGLIIDFLKENQVKEVGNKISANIDGEELIEDVEIYINGRLATRLLCDMLLQQD